MGESLITRKSSGGENLPLDYYETTMTVLANGAEQKIKKGDYITFSTLDYSLGTKKLIAAGTATTTIGFYSRVSSIAEMSSKKSIIFYRTSTNVLEFIVVNKNGTNFTFSNAISSGKTGQNNIDARINICKVNSNTFVIVYRNSSGNNLIANVGRLNNDDTITLGSDQTITTTVVNPYFTRIIENNFFISITTNNSTAVPVLYNYKIDPDNLTISNIVQTNLVNAVSEMYDFKKVQKNTFVLTYVSGSSLRADYVLVSVTSSGVGTITQQARTISTLYTLTTGFPANSLYLTNNFVLHWARMPSNTYYQYRTNIETFQDRIGVDSFTSASRNSFGIAVDKISERNYVEFLITNTTGKFDYRIMSYNALQGQTFISDLVPINLSNTLTASSRLAPYKYKDNSFLLLFIDINNNSYSVIPLIPNNQVIKADLDRFVEEIKGIALEDGTNGQNIKVALF